MKKMKTILLLLSVIIYSSTQAAIIYTDIPDGQPANIDFNQDSNPEFDITSMSGLGDYLVYFNFPLY